MHQHIPKCIEAHVLLLLLLLLLMQLQQAAREEGTTLPSNSLEVNFTLSHRIQWTGDISKLLPPQVESCDVLRENRLRGSGLTGLSVKLQPYLLHENITSRWRVSG